MVQSGERERERDRQTDRQIERQTERERLFIHISFVNLLIQSFSDTFIHLFICSIILHSLSRSHIPNLDPREKP